jgi:hypothetical protein
MKPHATCHLTLGRKAVCPWFTTVSHDWTSTHCKNAMVFRTLGEDGWSLQELLSDETWVPPAAGYIMKNTDAGATNGLGL